MTDASTAVSGSVRLERDGPIGWLILDHRERCNALSAAMWRALPGLIAEAEADGAIRVIVLRGAGTKAFSAGADISEFGTAREGEAARHYDTLNNAAFEALSGTAKPTVAMIRGFCLGGGLGLALSCDLRISAEEALFGLPPAKLGIGYDPRWIKPLVAAVGVAHAKELLFTAERIEASAALRIGLINRLLPTDTLEAGTRALAGTIAGNAPLTILAAKRAVDAYAGCVTAQTMSALDELIERCLHSADYEEGRRAFAEKRRPVFTGR